MTSRDPKSAVRKYDRLS